MSNVVGWDDVSPIAERAFSIWVGFPERRWAQEAWAHMTRAGLADTDGSAVRPRAYIRFLVLASIYRDWCAQVWDERHDDEPWYWLEPANVKPRSVGLLLESEVAPDDGDGLDEALNVLMDRERPVVVAALLEGFGGESGLFLALWRSNGGPEDELPPDEEDKWQAPPETDADILNDVTPEKMVGLQWILEGCSSIGPIRSTAEMDVW